jgi:cellulose biosynthesis protein BcsQ
MLYDASEIVPEECRGYASVKRYQRISSIYKKIMELYADVCQNYSVGGNGKTKLVAVYSPIGGSGKTTISCALANYLSMKGYKTIYVNMEEMASDGCYFPQTSDKNMSDLLSYIGGNTNFGVKLQGIQQTKKENLFYLNHFRSPNDIYEITDSEIEDFFAQISNTGLYDFVIIDMGVYLDHKAIKLFECVEKIVVVDKDDAFGRVKMARFMSQAHIINEYAYKMARVYNFGKKSKDIPAYKVSFAGVINYIQSAETEIIVNTIAERFMVGIAETIINS